MSLSNMISYGRSQSRVRRTCPRRSTGMRSTLECLEDRLCLSSSGLSSSLTPPDPGTQSRISQEYGQIPMSFEVNQGQTDPSVNFLSRGSGYGLYLTPTSAVLALQTSVVGRIGNPSASGSPAASQDQQALGRIANPSYTGAAPTESANVLRMQLIGGNTTARATGLDAQAGNSNDFIGNDASQWHSNITNYGRVEYDNVYRGIDLVYYGNQRQLEYDFVLAPGADPGTIQLAFTGASSITLDSSGDLVLHTSGGDVVEHAPVIYQETNSGRQAVSGHYALESSGQVGFVVGAYDATKALVIDPVLSYSTFLGGSGEDFGFAIAVDSAGNAYVTGSTLSLDFPTQNAVQPTSYGYRVGFVTKFNASGTALLYSTYLGGGNLVNGYAIAVDRSGDGYITGSTSGLLPVTAGAFQTTPHGYTNCYVTKLNPTGSAILYSTFLGSSGEDFGTGIAVDSAGNAYVTGWTQSTDFPTTVGAFQTTSSGISAFVTKLNAAGSALIYSTYLGGGDYDQATGIAIDAAGSAYVTGRTNGGFPITPAPSKP